MTIDSRARAGPARALRADAQRNRVRLIEAARTVFGDRGSEASMEEIAKAADVGVGTLYRHFPRRIDLVEAVYLEGVDELVSFAGAAAAQEAPWEALVSWLRAFVHYAETKRTFLTELHEAFEKNPGLALASRERLAEAAGQLLRRAQAAGAARPDIDQADLMQLVGGMCMARYSSLSQNERLLSFVLDGIRAR